MKHIRLIYFVLIIFLCVEFISCKTNSSETDKVEVIKEKASESETKKHETKLETNKSEIKESVSKVDSITITLSKELVYSRSDKNCRIGFIDNRFKAMFYPFNFKGFNSKRVSESFYDHVLIDSVEKEDVPGYKYNIFSYHDSLSHLRFLVKSFNENDWFYVDRGVIESNIFKSNNGIQIGMNKVDFYNSINESHRECDTFRISDGELATEYDFIFEQENLKKIIIWGH